MTDTERGHAVRWDISSAAISRKRTRSGAFYLGDHKDGPLRVVTAKRVVFDIKPDGTLVRYGKPVGRVDAAANTITLGTSVYALQFGARRSGSSP